MEERVEIAVGLVITALVASVPFASALWSGDAAAPPPEEAVAEPSPWREGVPDFGPPAGADVLALVAPLRVGSDLDGWTVEGLDAVTGGVVVVHLLHGTSRLNLQIALTEGGTVLPPATAGPYAIFATHLVGEDARGTVATSLSEALGRVLSANLPVPIPAGMGAYALRDATAPPTDRYAAPPE